VTGEDAPGKPANAPTKTKTAAPTPTKQTVTTTVAPGVTGTTAVDASSDASPAFRSFVAI